MIVPGLRHFWPRFAPGRLYEVPVKLGRLKGPLAEDQLNQVRRQVEQSTQPVVIADTDGRILTTNTAFDALLPDLPSPPEQITDLLQFVSVIDPAGMEPASTSVPTRSHPLVGSVPPGAVFPRCSRPRRWDRWRGR